MQLDPQNSAKALAALAGLLILALGSVLMISLFGRWMRRWMFSKRKQDPPSFDSQLGKLDWARPGDDEDKIDAQK